MGACLLTGRACSSVSHCNLLGTGWWTWRPNVDFTLYQRFYLISNVWRYFLSSFEPHLHRMQTLTMNLSHTPCFKDNVKGSKKKTRRKIRSQRTSWLTKLNYYVFRKDSATGDAIGLLHVVGKRCFKTDPGICLFNYEKTSITWVKQKSWVGDLYIFRSWLQRR